MAAIKSVRFKNASARLHLPGRTVSNADLTPDLYMRLVKLNAGHARLFDVEYEEDVKEKKSKVKSNDTEAKEG